MAGLIPFNRRSLSVRPPMRSDFYNMLDSFFSDNWMGGRSLLTDTFKLDVKEDADFYIVEAELPGVPREELGLALQDECLTLSVNREAVNEEKDEDKNYLHRERQYSSMRRAVYLVDSDEHNVKAKLEDGVLRVTIGKQAKEARRAQIEIE